MYQKSVKPNCVRSPIASVAIDRADVALIIDALLQAKMTLPLSDERYKVSGYNFVNQTGPTTFVPTLGREGTLTAFYGDPRTWWVSLTTEF